MSSTTVSRWARVAAGLAMASCVALATAAGPVPSRAAGIDARLAAAQPFDERPLDGYSAEGARVSAWGTRRAIEKISVEGLGERGRSQIDFYWRAGALVAAHERRFDYGASIVDLPKDRPVPQTAVADDWYDFAGASRPAPRAVELRAEARSLRRLMTTPASPAAGACAWSCAVERGGECFRYRCR